MDELKPGIKQKNRRRKKLGRRDLPGRRPAPVQETAQPTTRTGPRHHTDSGLRLPRDEAARWSSGRHPIHRRLLDVQDGGRRPPSSIKSEPPLWISPRSPVPSPTSGSLPEPKP
jgi:hypothetical protein